MQIHKVDMQTHGVRGATPQEAELTFACLGASKFEPISRWCAQALHIISSAVVFRGVRVEMLIGLPVPTRDAVKDANADRLLLAFWNGVLSVCDVVQWVKKP